MANANIPSENWIITVQITKYLDVRSATKDRAMTLAKRLVQQQFGKQDTEIVSIERG